MPELLFDPPPMKADLLTAQQVAERLSISVRTVQRMVLRGELPHPIRYNRKLVRWLADEIDDHLAARRAAKQATRK